ncbi:MAG: PilZ domain-containing protein [Planctomycetota bacterium]
MPKDESTGGRGSAPAKGPFGAIDRAIEEERYDEAWEKVREILAKDPDSEEANLRRLYLEALEQRQAKRFRRDMVLFLERPDFSEFPCRLLDISEGGMRIRAARNLSRGESLLLVLRPSASDALKIRCRVAWTKPDARGCSAGLEFLAGTDSDRRWVLNLLDLALSPKSREPKP